MQLLFSVENSCAGGDQLRVGGVLCVAGLVAVVYVARHVQRQDAENVVVELRAAIAAYSTCWPKAKRPRHW